MKPLFYDGDSIHQLSVLREKRVDIFFFFFFFFFFFPEPHNSRKDEAEAEPAEEERESALSLLNEETQILATPPTCTCILFFVFFSFTVLPFRRRRIKAEWSSSAVVIRRTGPVDWRRLPVTAGVFFSRVFFGFTPFCVESPSGFGIAGRPPPLLPVECHRAFLTVAPWSWATHW